MDYVTFHIRYTRGLFGITGILFSMKNILCIWPYQIVEISNNLLNLPLNQNLLRQYKNEEVLLIYNFHLEIIIY